MKYGEQNAANRGFRIFWHHEPSTDHATRQFLRIGQGVSPFDQRLIIWNARNIAVKCSQLALGLETTDSGTGNYVRGVERSSCKGVAETSDGDGIVTEGRTCKDVLERAAGMSCCESPHQEPDIDPLRTLIR